MKRLSWFGYAMAAYAVVAAFAIGFNPDFMPVKMPVMETWDEIAENSVLIGRDGKDFCSGTIVGHGIDGSGEFSIVATAAHCFKNRKFPITVTRHYEKQAASVGPGVLLSIDFGLDVAVIKSSVNARGRCVNVVENPVMYNRGDSVFTLSHFGLSAEGSVDYSVLTTGIISTPERLNSYATGETTREVSMNTTVMPGSSGGAVLDSKGRMIGVITGGRFPYAASAFAPVSALKAVLQKLGIGEHICYG